MDLAPARKRSVVIDGRSTSISLEDEFWQGLNMLAIAQDISMRECIGRIARQRATTNLSSTIRVAILSYYQGLAAGMTHATSRTVGAAMADERALSGVTLGHADKVACEIVPIRANAR